MNRPAILARLAGAAVLFVYSAIAWMVLPWIEGTLRAFPNQQAVVQVMSQIPEAGVYAYPSPDTEMTGTADMKGPAVFAAVRPGPPAPATSASRTWNTTPFRISPQPLDDPWKVFASAVAWVRDEADENRVA